jgi:Rrf2 family protein
MLKLTKRTEYGLIALTHLAQRRGEVVPVREIGDRYPIPRRLLAEVLKDLCHANLVASTRGAHGGYALVRPAQELSLGEIVSALEGAPTVSSCGDEDLLHGEHSCDVHPVCPIRSPLEKIKDKIWQMMLTTSLASLAQPDKPYRSLASQTQANGLVKSSANSS